ncbi:WD40-repeat-containing domain protein [Mycena sp. CBHHK59/15]|nr:WD40-repeat-containing domain protein [Mycena sp. CBHHK59/15]
MELIVNPAHGPGFTCLAFSRDGIRIFTGGDDGIVRIWKVAEGSEQEPATAAEAEGPITSIAISDDYWFSGSEDSEVRRYVKDSGQLDGYLTAAKSEAVRCVAIDPRGKTVAVASDELDVKLVDMDDPIKVKFLKGHRRGICKTTWHPTAPLLTTCGHDGQIIVWDVSKDKPEVVVQLEGILPTVLENQKGVIHDCSAVWHPSGDYFFVPSRGHEIVTITRSEWKKKYTFSDNNTPGPITALAVSPNGAYLASASPSKVHIWSTMTRRVIASHTCNSQMIITQLAFSPTQNLIAWTSEDGVFTRWPNPISDTFSDPVKPATELAGSAVVSLAQELPPALFDTDDVEGVDAGDADLDNVSEGPNDWIDDDDDVEDLGDIASEGMGTAFVKEMVSITKAQPPFQPGATPMVDKKRYLAFNLLGVIETTDVSEQGHHVVTVAFFDQSARKGLRFEDSDKCDLGYLGERGAVFACKPRTAHPARVSYKPYGTYSGESEWKYPLRAGSVVLGIAAGGLSPSRNMRESSDGDLDGFGNVVVATSEGDLTFLSGTGRERRIMGLGADFVSMVAGAEWVFVVHRAGSTTIDGSQNLSYSIINFEDFSVRQRDVLPIPKGHTLKWIGITDEGAPAMYDTTGRVHVLTKFRIPHHASWARVMDTNLLERRKGKDESYWPIGIHGSIFTCVILKGTQEHPGFPRPLHQDLPMRFPFRAENASEEETEREMLFLETSRDALDDELTNEAIVAREHAIDKEFIKLIGEACKSSNIPRAIELAKLVHHPKVLDLIIRLSQFHHLPGLTEKVQTLKSTREENEDRLILARDKRRQWIRPDPPPRRLVPVADTASSRPKAFQDFGPPPSVLRPGLALAVPAKETTRYMVNTAGGGLQSTQTESVASSPPDGKRKRIEEDDAAPSSDFDLPPPKQKINPFARKAGQENGRSPFGRKPELNKTIQKSESFFDKVDAAEEDAPKLKRLLNLLS